MRIDVKHAQNAASLLMRAAGMSQAQGDSVARRMIAADLYGHSTHGLAMVSMYLERLADGRIRTEGEPAEVREGDTAFAWQCGRLPGAWVMEKAIARLLSLADGRHPTLTATLANCSHIGALQVYLDDFVSRGLMAFILVTDPGVASVAPYGGATPVLTSNPLAVGIPTRDEPILIDVSTSVTSNAAVRGYQDAGRRLPGPWLLDNQGRASDDPAVLNTQPPGTLLPLGGLEFGHKGFGLGLMVEAFALALTGHGRHQQHARGSQGVFLQVLNPALLGGGRETFLDETTWLRQRCLASTPAEGRDGVRLPGQRARERRADQLANGLLLEERLVAAFDAKAASFGTPRLA